jgi:hypothetical protein
MDHKGYFSKIVFDADEVYSCGDRALSVPKERFLIVNGLWFALMENVKFSHRPTPEE